MKRDEWIAIGLTILLCGLAYALSDINWDYRPESNGRVYRVD